MAKKLNVTAQEYSRLMEVVTRSNNEAELTQGFVEIFGPYVYEKAKSYREAIHVEVHNMAPGIPYVGNGKRVMRFGM
jgi:hypothetical protein